MTMAEEILIPSWTPAADTAAWEGPVAVLDEIEQCGQWFIPSSCEVICRLPIPVCVASAETVGGLAAVGQMESLTVFRGLGEIRGQGRLDLAAAQLLDEGGRGDVALVAQSTAQQMTLDGPLLRLDQMRWQALLLGLSPWPGRTMINIACLGA
jgi:hypothetical protein